MLEKRKGVTKDTKGCEFPYEFLGSYEWELNKNNKLVKVYDYKLYVALWWNDIKAISLKELKEMVGNI